MAFGQQQGFPASARQIQRLADLVVAAGHTGFRDARGPLGLSQRQAGGRFTRDEADELIARLEAEVDARDEAATDEPAPAPRARPAVDRRTKGRTPSLRQVPAEALAAELQRRGWVVLEP